MTDEHDFFGTVLGLEPPTPNKTEKADQALERSSTISRFSSELSAHKAHQKTYYQSHTEAAFKNFRFRYSDPHTHNLVTADELMTEDMRSRSGVRSESSSARDEKPSANGRPAPTRSAMPLKRLNLIEKPIDEPAASEDKTPGRKSGVIFKQSKGEAPEFDVRGAKPGMAEAIVPVAHTKPRNAHLKVGKTRKAPTPWELALDKIGKV